VKYGNAENELGYDSSGGIIEPTINSKGDFKTIAKPSIVSFSNSTSQAYYSERIYGCGKNLPVKV
jgi:hypothetical protein